MPELLPTEPTGGGELDPYSDLDVLQAVAQTRFAWGSSAREHQDSFYVLMEHRYGYDRQSASELLKILNTYRPAVEED